ncbi:MAG: tRNA preQ1(34) S-adenosylmethionine ribosyltransferase-isomerase QueA [Hyphomicrobiaceae bacterium]|nr:tRNA preQ1(34) S-adenosylmethionine ribosyltransferase-isomerase QueA [Hyphomicrobiaceae bacterium]
MRVDLFDFELPPDRIALHPADPRDSARLLHVAADGALTDRHIPDLLDFLDSGDVLVVNDTRVLPAELSGTRFRGENRASISFNLHRRLDAERWAAFARPAKRLKPADLIAFGSEDDRACAILSLGAEVEEVREAGEVVLRFDKSGAYLDETIKGLGAMPLPPYIASRRTITETDKTDYQTIFAEIDGAVAAPTAGLHFTEDLLERIAEKGVELVRITLHVGAGTFLPVKSDDTAGHKMHAEWIEVSDVAVDAINSARRRGNKCVAVGTTSLRSLEAASQAAGSLKPYTGETDIFITPGYGFKTVDMLMTNFHLPRSTLFMLVAAFSGLETMQKAYRHAIENEYRFYSYGDACLLERADLSAAR